MRVITPQSYRRDDADKKLADMVLARLSLNPNDVYLVEFSEGGVAVEGYAKHDDGKLVVVDGKLKRWRIEL